MLSYKTRRLLSLIILLLGLPLYIVLAVTLIDLLGSQNLFFELLIYCVLGLAWIFPLKSIFKGIGQENNDGK